MTRPLVVLLTVLFLTVGFAPLGVAGAVDTKPTADVTQPGSSTVSPSTAAETTAETGDKLGCVDGICHDDELDFETTTALSDAELDALVARTMARVEKLRGEQFTDSVPVEVQSRETFQESDIINTSNTETADRWNDQVWKALFVVGEDEPSADAIDSTVGEAVNGYYHPTETRIVLITDNPDSPTVDEETLLHEFVHALQDQRHDLTSSQFRGETQDRDLAVNGVFEGEARLLEYQYQARCGVDWACFDRPSTVGGGAASNLGVLFTLLQPYADGPAYVDEIIKSEGWDGVDDRFDEPPQTTREIIYREPVEAVSLDVTDEATDGWERYPDQGRNGAETAGEASMFVMLWYQAREYGAETVGTDAIHETTHEHQQYNYVSDPSSGWVADELIPYQRGDDDGYVWTIEWDTRQDTAEFRRAYGAILDAHDATETDDGVYVVDDGPFRGAYAVDTDGTQLTIVHASTEAGLFELRPSLDPASLDAWPILADDIPGFGVAAALAALFAFVIASRRVR